jgi:phenylpropionate dioxygenase-like ring-hydroxylating dioxygenase large terminal subunit
MAIETTATTPTELMRTLPASAYRSPEHHAREVERIFHREWFAVGRAERLGAGGDYLHVDVAGERVLVVRPGRRAPRVL